MSPANKWPVRVRYVLMGIHLSFIVAVLVQALLQSRNAITLLVHAAAAVAFLIYIPAAVFISVTSTRCGFDQMGGELAYLFVQGVICIFSATASLLISSRVPCTAVAPSPYAAIGPDWITSDATYHSYCSALTTTAVLSLVHFGMLLGWLMWLLLEVRRNFRGRIGQGFRCGTARLLRGEGRI